MIDFDKLTENINAINEVINDLETETKAIRKNVECKKADAFEIMYNDVLKYIRLILKANNGKSNMFGLNVMFDDGYAIRIAKDWHCGNYYYCLKVREDYCDDWYPIWISNPDYPYNKYVFEGLNRSPKGVKWLVDVVAINWDFYKIRIEKLVAKYVNNIITERSKKMHKEYERVSNEAERLGI